jgi:two-component system, OmpR family, alkaline phosphatase synthesis response regulator PhoP
MDLSNYKILIVDDEKDIIEFVGYNLRKEGYNILTCTNGEDALKKAIQYTPHLIILDIMMPGMDGIEVCSELRRIPSLRDTIITFLTARGEEYSQIAGLQAGADDYITKPIKPKILISKIRSLLRRQIDLKRTSPVYEAGNLTIDSEEYLVIFNNTKYVLPRKEFELLSLLSSKPNKVFTRDEIFNQIWTADISVSDRTIDVHIHKLREKFGPDVIKTIKGVGYRYEFRSKDGNSHHTESLP